VYILIELIFDFFLVIDNQQSYEYFAIFTYTRLLFLFNRGLSAMYSVIAASPQ